ncbi:hypothetical protein BH24ACT7_BH24ACT7_06160 [soil metagenome]
MDLLLCLIIGAIAGGWFIWWLIDLQPPSERESALRAELDALRTAQHLALTAWRTRQAMRSAGPDGDVSR